MLKRLFQFQKVSKWEEVKEEKIHEMEKSIRV